MRLALIVAASFALAASAAFGQSPGAVPATSRPNPALTPGVTRPLTLDVVCNTKWGRDHRAVTEAMKRQVFKSYGFTGNDDPRCAPDPKNPKQRCEIDHLVSRELSGADDVKNLWPEPYGGKWNAHDKDRVENTLHAAVCVTHTMTMQDAQQAIRTDWIGTYIKLLGQPTH